METVIIIGVLGLSLFTGIATGAVIILAQVFKRSA